jgi:GNAT superfamily N-acetyltransferase
MLAKLLRHEARYFTMVASVEQMPHAWYLFGPELPDYRDANHALHLRDDGRGPESVVREVLAYYRSRGLPPVVDVDDEAEAQGMGTVLRRLGVTPVIGDTLLMRYAPSAPPTLPERNVEVREIDRDAEPEAVRLWIEMAVSDTVGSAYEEMWRAAAEREAHFPPCRLFLGYLDGQPAGACDLFTAEGWGRVDSVATHPEFRRRGVASAVVAQAVAASLTLGNEVTYLFTEAGGAGEQVYTRLGFAAWGLNVLRRHIGR